MRIAFAGGGTGGHVFPIQSLIKHIDRVAPRCHTYFRFGEKPSLEFDIYMKLRNSVHGLHFISVLSGKLRREKELHAILKNLWDLVKLGIGFFQALAELISSRTDIIFCKGGYVSLPVVVAGRVLRKKIFLHESDTTPGLSNRICSKFASVIFTGFKDVFPGKEIVVGQILDDDICSNEGKKEEGNITHMLVTGGSQGSESVYNALKDIIARHDFTHTHFHVLLGTRNKQLHNIFSGFKNITTYGFADQKLMGELLDRCDVSITRGGTTSLAEQHLFGLKKIIIPIPWTHDQYKNAAYYRDQHSDILVKQNDEMFMASLEKAVIENASYKKKTYASPLSSIQKTKDTILSYLVKDFHI